MTRTWHPFALVAATAGACLIGGAPAAHAVGPTTVRASVSSTGAQARTAVTIAPAGVSDTGRYVLESSKSSRLVARDTNGSFDVFLRDVQTGKTTRVSVSSTGQQANGASIADALSPDGRFVLFSSGASNLSVAADTNHRTDVFVRDRVLGITRRVSVPPPGGQFAGPSNGVAMSADGRFVLFTTSPPGHSLRTYLRDRRLGVTTRVGRAWDRWVVEGLALSGNGRMGAQLADGVAFPDVGPLAAVAALSGDGRFLAFDSADATVVAGDTNATIDVFLRGPLS